MAVPGETAAATLLRRSITGTCPSRSLARSRRDSKLTVDATIFRRRRRARQSSHCDRAGISRRHAPCVQTGLASEVARCVPDADSAGRLPAPASRARFSVVLVHGPGSPWVSVVHHGPGLLVLVIERVHRRCAARGALFQSRRRDGVDARLPANRARVLVGELRQREDRLCLSHLLSSEVGEKLVAVYAAFSGDHKSLCADHDRRQVCEVYCPWECRAG